MFLYSNPRAGGKKPSQTLPNLDGAQPVVKMGMVASQAPAMEPAPTPAMPEPMQPTPLWAGPGQGHKNRGGGRGGYGNIPGLGGQGKRFMRDFSGSQDDNAPGWMKDPMKFAQHAMDYNGGAGLPPGLARKLERMAPMMQPQVPPPPAMLADPSTAPSAAAATSPMAPRRDWSKFMPYVTKTGGPK